MAAISELKAKPGGELQVHGSGILTRWLLENDLVEEMIPIVILGQGARPVRILRSTRSSRGSARRA
ncbi:hypothetical protein [Nonomuraea insulae]|uniref:Bacterial bifunctional deaminase-reductase C-terminal domain-containing protein n=1 Tax=Nonomuraea insulae TaxID=1616787 RepID=A0ABW1CEP5_9ACTN